jgi:hypothetical protein
MNQTLEGLQRWVRPVASVAILAVGGRADFAALNQWSGVLPAHARPVALLLWATLPIVLSFLAEWLLGAFPRAFPAAVTAGIVLWLPCGQNPASAVVGGALLLTGLEPDTWGLVRCAEAVTAVVIAASLGPLIASWGQLVAYCAVCIAVWAAASHTPRSGPRRPAQVVEHRRRQRRVAPTMTIALNAKLGLYNMSFEVYDRGVVALAGVEFVELAQPEQLDQITAYFENRIGRPAILYEVITGRGAVQVSPEAVRDDMRLGWCAPDGSDKRRLGTVLGSATR